MVLKMSEVVENCDGWIVSDESECVEEESKRGFYAAGEPRNGRRH